MAESVIKKMTSDATTATSNVNFSAIAPTAGIGAALDSFASNIGSYTSGVHTVAGSGTQYFVVAGIYSSNYYAGLLFSYGALRLTLFAFSNGTYKVKLIANEK